MGVNPYSRLGELLRDRHQPVTADIGVWRSLLSRSGVLERCPE